MHNFKPGDLALVVGFTKSSSLLGKVVEVSQRICPGHTFKGPDGMDRLLRGTNPCWIVVGENIVSIDGNRGWAAVCEHNLMPLRGDFAPERQKSQELPA